MRMDDNKAKFLVNMAVVKVNWDEGRNDILDNYMPLLGYAVKCCDQDVVAVEDVEAKLQSIADFKIPRGAVITLLKRASKPKYGYVAKEHHKYVRVPERLDNLNYEKLRDEQTRRFNGLRDKFHSFCAERYNVTIGADEAEEYFFTILYEIAPSIYNSLKPNEDKHAEETTPEITKKYLVGRFVQHVVNSDPVAFSALEAFVRGAMLTETFYYSNPEDIPRKFQRTTVFFDTTFLIRFLGYCEQAISAPCKELYDMLHTMGVKMRCFRKTYDEIHGILYAAALKLPGGGLGVPNRPGDAVDFFAHKGLRTSDIELLIAKLHHNLARLDIHVVEHPPHEKTLSVDEKKLNEYISQFIERQSEKARWHDIDCLTSVFRLRRGKPMEYLESCEAIFVTTNTALARGATQFFNSEHAISHAPVCMSDQVFTTLVWLKAVKKVPDLPKERLVANCFAALNPSEAMWEKYVKEADKLLASGEIEERDYAILIHSLEARTTFMDRTLGDEDVSLEGTVPDVLEQAKAHYLGEAKSNLEVAQRQLSLSEMQRETFLRSISDCVLLLVKWSLLTAWILLLLAGLIMTSPRDLHALNLLKAPSIGGVVKGLTFAILCLFSLLNLVFGTRVFSVCKWLAQCAAVGVAGRVRRTFFSEVKAGVIAGKTSG